MSKQIELMAKFVIHFQQGKMKVRRRHHSDGYGCRRQGNRVRIPRPSLLEYSQG